MLDRVERTSLIEQTRSRYLKELASALTSLSSQGRTVFAEICLELPRPEASNELYRLYVADIFERLPDGDSKIVEINIDPTFLEFQELPINAPIAWNAVEFRCAPEHFPEDALVAWGTRWINDECPPLGPQDNLTGIIHSVTEPTRAGPHVEFSVDFGSAPLVAFNELIALLGGSLRSIGSYSLAGSAV